VGAGGVRIKVPWPLAMREVLLSEYELEYFEEDLIVVMYASVCFGSPTHSSVLQYHVYASASTATFDWDVKASVLFTTSFLPLNSDTLWLMKWDVRDESFMV
jgi:hypothetical protein